MSSGVYCSYCHHTWKIQKEYDRHLGCCQYFYHQRRNPPKQEMTERAYRPKTHRELCDFVESLSARLDKTEKELARLRNSVSTRQKKAVLEWLNNPSQTPAETFESWWRRFEAVDEDVQQTLRKDLSEGIKSCLDNQLALSEGQRLPIRCFAQKPNFFYVYSLDAGNRDGNQASQPMWRLLSNDQLKRMVLHISQSILRVFLVWQNNHLNTVLRGSDEDEEHFGPDDDRAMDRQVMLMMRINGNHVPIDRRLPDLKKYLFFKLEENLRIVADCDFT